MATDADLRKFRTYETMKQEKKYLLEKYGTQSHGKT